jgi:hypothetical protein
MKTYLVLKKASRHDDVWESGGIAPRINFDARLRLVVSFTPQPLYPLENSSRYPLDTRLGGLRRRSRRGGEESPSPCRESNPGRRSRSLVTILTELSRLLPERIGT